MGEAICLVVSPLGHTAWKSQQSFFAVLNVPFANYSCWLNENSATLQLLSLAALVLLSLLFKGTKAA